MIKYGFFNAKKLITGDYDRKYNADDVNAYFKGAISQDGIYQFVGNQCRVTPAGAMNVAVRDGKGQINYHWFEVTANEVLTIREAHATLNRWTAIVARYDATNRNIYLLTIDGNESERPSKPQMQRSDVLRDICLAYVYVAAGVTEITINDIEDTVEDIEVCGFVSTLLAGIGQTIKVPQLPLPSSSCQGNIYYLTREGKTAGRKYVKGYYYCEPSSTTYDYVNYDFISDVLGNRPTASTEYLEILFYATDSSGWYECVEVSENVYEWQSVAVNEVEELPEPTEDINNQFYIHGNSLYRVREQSTNYKWYSFSLGSGGGKGDFAIIQIEYPEGCNVEVTYDGDTIAAPDTSGVWLYGCDEAGVYTIRIVGTQAQQQIEITTKGQIETIWVSPQVVNYGLLYYLGEEFATIPSEYGDGGVIQTGGIRAYTAKSVSTDTYEGAGIAETFINVDFSQYTKIYMFCKKYTPNTSSGSIISSIGGTQFTYVSPQSGAYYLKAAPTLWLMTLSKGFNVNEIILSNISNVESKNMKIALCNTLYYYQTHNSHCVKDSTNIYMYDKVIVSGQESASVSSWIRIYAFGFCKEDNLIGLSAYGSDIATILSNAVSLFNDISALNYIALNCTGDFMISALQNSNFVNVMNVSENKTILTSNKHWARFIALLSV